MSLNPSEVFPEQAEMRGDQVMAALGIADLEADVKVAEAKGGNVLARCKGGVEVVFSGVAGKRSYSLQGPSVALNNALTRLSQGLSLERDLDL